MNLTQEQFDAWIAALKSGRYSQITNFLASDYNDGYCCMGVCGMVIGLTKREMAGVTVLSNMFQLPEVFTRDEENVLGILNDQIRLDFRDIAAFVEAGALDAFTVRKDGTLQEVWP